MYQKILKLFHTHCSIYILQEGFFNITIQPWSPVHVDHDPILVQLEMVGLVQGVLVDDFRIITNKEQNKWFEIKFDAIGAGTCIVVDYKDGYIAAYGDPDFCSSWTRSASLSYVQGYEIIENPFLIDHVYL